MEMMVRHPIPRIPHPQDVKLGNRLREVRESLNITQEIVAREAGISLQQIQKYEHAQNRVSWSRLCELAAALDTDVITLIKPLMKKRGQ